MEKTKTVYIHIGPHKTGTSAIQKYFSTHAKSLEKAGLLFLNSPGSHRAALDIATGNYVSAEERLGDLTKQISESPSETILISHEDFSGNLPGRGGSRKIYPNLAQNLETIARSLSPHQTFFIFFERTEDRWLRSCYYQNLKYRTDFSNFETYRQRFENFTWSSKLKRAKAIFGDRLIVVPYSEMPDSGVSALFDIIGLKGIKIEQSVEVQNSSPNQSIIEMLESINVRTSYKSTAWFAKKLVLTGWKPVPPEASDRTTLPLISPLCELALPSLTRRISNTKPYQDADDILPEKDVDLQELSRTFLPVDAVMPSESRANIRNQSRILDYHFRGRSQLAKLNALTISYLRRDTPHTQKAKFLFHRIWLEVGPLLVNEISSRWLISTLQTFLDHGLNEGQRIIGATGFFYANLMKIYECERSIEGHEQDGTYEHNLPQTPSRFRGLDRFPLGGSDILLNTNVRALEIASLDDAAGLVLCEFLLRVQSSGNVFTRMDQTRKKQGISVPGFEDTWSFFRNQNNG